MKLSDALGHLQKLKVHREPWRGFGGLVECLQSVRQPKGDWAMSVSGICQIGLPHVPVCTSVLYCAPWPHVTVLCKLEAI